MTVKRFTVMSSYLGLYKIFDEKRGMPLNSREVVDVMNAVIKENEDLKQKLDGWHKRTFKAHEYFTILEKVIDEVCDDEISNKIWKEYAKREKLIE